jgi:hypothetical protein
VSTNVLIIVIIAAIAVGVWAFVVIKRRKAPDAPSPLEEEPAIDAPARPAFVVPPEVVPEEPEPEPETIAPLEPAPVPPVWEETKFQVEHTARMEAERLAAEAARAEEEALLAAARAEQERFLAGLDPDNIDVAYLLVDPETGELATNLSWAEKAKDTERKRVPLDLDLS